MCGIVGYIGKRDSAPILLESLRRLEYRGYDSAGIATLADKLYVKKDAGRIEDLAASLDLQGMPGKAGIAHTRWATHGIPSQENAHPHMDCSHSLAIIHNGIIENFAELRQELLQRGHKFSSETDTEVISHLIEENMHDNVKLEDAVGKALERLKGTYALAVISEKDPNKIVVTRKMSPLVIGLGDDEFFAASDIPAFLSSTNRVLMLEDGEIAILTPEKVSILKNGREVRRKVQVIDWKPEMVKKNGYPHFMLKEIYEQPECVDRVLSQDLKNIEEVAAGIKKAKHVVMVACGTSRHAALIGRYMLMKTAKKFCDVMLASEFSHFTETVDENTVVIAISQSGETADVIDAVLKAKGRKAKIYSIVNVVGSMLTRESDRVIYLQSGPEMSVVATKTFISQLLVFALLSFIMSGKTKQGLQKMRTLKEMMKETIEKNAEKTKALAKKLKDSESVYFIGRGINFATAIEGSLKFKEISYIHAEGMPAGELKHGTLSLVEKGVPVVTIAPKDDTYYDTISNALEVKSRKGFLIGVSDEENDIFDETLLIPKCNELFYPLLCTIPLQLLAYYVTLEKGNDPDRPRNLAKAVTVK